MNYQIKLEEITIYGFQNQPTKIKWNGRILLNTKWTFNSTFKVFQMKNLSLDFSQTHKFHFS
jgi:hypothetical protein